MSKNKTLEVFEYPDGRMDAKNAAAYLGKSTKTLAMMRCLGTGPRFVKRGRIFYFREVLDAWIREGSATSTAQARSIGIMCQRSVQPASPQEERS